MSGNKNWWMVPAGIGAAVAAPELLAALGPSASGAAAAGAGELAGGLGAGAADEVMGGLAMGSPEASPGLLGNASIALGNFNSAYPAVGKTLGNPMAQTLLANMAAGAPPPQTPSSPRGPTPMPSQNASPNILGSFYGNSPPQVGGGVGGGPPFPNVPGIGISNLDIRKRLASLGIGGF